MEKDLLYMQMVRTGRKRLLNGESEHRADFRCLDDSCECWEGIENE